MCTNDPTIKWGIVSRVVNKTHIDAFIKLECNPDFTYFNISPRKKYLLIRSYNKR